jgi:hypothetical protein
MFRSTTIIRELVLSLVKVMLEHLCPSKLCGGGAACLGSGVYVVCCSITCSNITLARLSTSSLMMVVDRNM